MKEKILEILRGIDETVDYETSDNFIEDGIIDSYQMVEIIDGLESEFDIEISGRDIVPENFANLDSIEAMLKKYIGE